VRYDPNPAGINALLDGLDRAHDAALEDIRQEAAANAPKQTGEFAASIQASRSGEHGSLYTGLPQGGAVERGANVGARKGPHMTGSHVMADAGAHFPDKMYARLRV